MVHAAAVAAVADRALSPALAVSPAPVLNGASHRARLAADRRLHHVVQGGCGSAISALMSLRQLLDPYLKQELPFDIEALLVAPISHLQEAIAWCHRRQVFVQLEERVYISQHTPVNLNKLLDSVSASGTVFSEDDAPLALDETVLRIALDEIVANALKYRKDDTPIRMFAHYTAGMLRLEVQNINPDGFMPLTAEECRRVFDSEFKMRHCSAMSDGLGLDSVALAVNAAGGSVSLESSSEATLVRISLPATLCHTQPAEQSSSPDRSASAPSGVRAWIGQHTYPPALHPGKKSTVKRSSPLKHADGERTGWQRRACIGQSISLSQLRQPLAGFGEKVERCGSEKRSLDSPLPHCIGLSDAGNHAAIAALFSDCLKAKRDVCVLQATQQELSSFVDKVIDRVDIVVVSHVISVVDGPEGPLLGTDVAQRLRGRGYLGVICIFGSEMTDDEREDISAHPAVDLLIQQSQSMEGASNAINRYHALRSGLSGTRSAEFGAADTEECVQEDRDWRANASLGGSPFDITERMSALELVTARGRISVEKDNAHRPHSSRPVKLTSFVRPRPPPPGGNMPRINPSNLLHAKCQPVSRSPTVSSGRPVPRACTTRPGPMLPFIRPKSPLATPDFLDGEGCTWSPPPYRPEPSAVPLIRPTPLVPTAPLILWAPLPDQGQTSPLPDFDTPSHTQCKLGSHAADAPTDKPAADMPLKPLPDPPTLRVIGLDDEQIPRMIQAMFIKHHLKADPEVSCALGKTAQEIGAFVDVVLGRLHPDLTINEGVQRHADIVLLDENIAPPNVLGSILATQLAEGGFRGVTVLLTGTSAVHLAQLRSLPHVDLAYEKGFPLQRMAEDIKAILAAKRVLA